MPRKRPTKYNDRKNAQYYKMEDRKRNLARALLQDAPDLLIHTQMKMVAKSMRQVYGWRYNTSWTFQKLWIRFTNQFRK